MRIPEFALERFFARWEFAVRHLLCASDVEGWRMADLLSLADDETAALWSNLRLGYTEAPGHPLLRAEIATLYDTIEADDVSSDRLRSILLSTFAAVAVVLATLGLYGVMAYSVTQRTREIGIRAALGANAVSLLCLVMRQGTAMIAWGLGVGFVITLGESRLLKAFLFGVGPSDPKTMVFVAAVLSAVALIACYLPARRTTMVDPLIVLKSE